MKEGRKERRKEAMKEGRKERRKEVYSLSMSKSVGRSEWTRSVGLPQTTCRATQPPIILEKVVQAPASSWQKCESHCSRRVFSI